MRQAILETDIKRTSMGHPRLGRHRTRGRIDRRRGHGKRVAAADGLGLFGGGF